MRPAALGLTIHASVAAAASGEQAEKVRPVVGYFLGYEFEWGPMVAGLLACAAVRFYVSKTEPEHRWTIDAPVSVLTLLFTAGVIIAWRPIPLLALGWGTGLGALGAGLIRIALAFVQRNLGPLDPGDEQPKSPTA